MRSVSKGLVLLLIFFAASTLVMVKPASAQQAPVQEVATLASISIQPQSVIQGQPFTVVAQIYPSPPPNAENKVFYNILIIVTSAAQGVSGYGPWDSGLFIQRCKWRGKLYFSWNGKHNDSRNGRREYRSAFLWTILWQYHHNALSRGRLADEFLRYF